MHNSPAQLTAEHIANDFVHYCDTTQSFPDSLTQFVAQQDYDFDSLQQVFKTTLELERFIFKLFFEHTHQLLQDDLAYPDYGFEEKALAFYYTFFELLSANRTFVHLSLTRGASELQNLPKLNELQKVFKAFVLEIYPGTMGLLGSVPLLNTLQERLVAEAAWLQFLGVLKFWLDDRSTDCERSDVMIEKALAAGFELLSLSQLRSVTDFIKFCLTRPGS